MLRSNPLLAAACPRHPIGIIPSHLVSFPRRRVGGNPDLHGDDKEVQGLQMIAAQLGLFVRLHAATCSRHPRIPDQVRDDVGSQARIT